MGGEEGRMMNEREEEGRNKGKERERERKTIKLQRQKTSVVFVCPPHESDVMIHCL